MLKSKSQKSPVHQSIGFHGEPLAQLNIKDHASLLTLFQLSELLKVSLQFSSELNNNFQYSKLLTAHQVTEIADAMAEQWISRSTMLDLLELILGTHIHMLDTNNNAKPLLDYSESRVPLQFLIVIA